MKYYRLNLCVLIICLFLTSCSCNESDEISAFNALNILNSINYADENLGCRKRISSGISWVFSETEEAIILEDDCIPDLAFFLGSVRVK